MESTSVDTMPALLASSDRGPEEHLGIRKIAKLKKLAEAQTDNDFSFLCHLQQPDQFIFT